jgi:hypothetical protein
MALKQQMTPCQEAGGWWSCWGGGGQLQRWDAQSGCFMGARSFVYDWQYFKISSFSPWGILLDLWNETLVEPIEK